MIVRTIAAGTHGRYVVAPPESPGPAPLLVGFHGYAESADVQLERLRAIPGGERWRLVSIQGLHRFYQRRTNDVVASWMTRQDREHAIDDNVAYVVAVIDAASREWPTAGPVVLAGFSQGVSMMFRVAVAAGRSVGGVIAVGGDIPPEVDASALARIPLALVCRGNRDEWYSAGKFEQDIRRLTEAGTRVDTVLFDGGHEWSTEVLEAASVFLREQRP